MSKLIEKEMIEQLINSTRKMFEEAAKEFNKETKERTLKEMLDNSTKFQLKRASGNYNSKEEIIERLSKIFKEVLIDGDKLYILTKENEVYSYLIYKNGMDNNKFNLIGAEKVEL